LKEEKEKHTAWLVAHGHTSAELKKALEEKKEIEILFKQAQAKVETLEKDAQTGLDGEAQDILSQVRSDLDDAMADNVTLRDEIRIANTHNNELRKILHSSRAEFEALKLEFDSFREKTKDELAKELSEKYQKDFAADVEHEKYQNLKLAEENAVLLRKIRAMQEHSEELTIKIQRMEAEASDLNTSNVSNSGSRSQYPYDRNAVDAEIAKYVQIIQTLEGAVHAANAECIKKVRENSQLSTMLAMCKAHAHDAQTETNRVQIEFQSAQLTLDGFVKRFKNFHGKMYMMRKGFAAFKKCLEVVKHAAHAKNKAVIRIIRGWYKFSRVKRGQAQNFYWRTVSLAEKLLKSRYFLALVRARNINEEDEIRRIEGPDRVQPRAFLQEETLSAEDRQVLEAKYNEYASLANKLRACAIAEDPPYDGLASPAAASSPAKPVSASVLVDAGRTGVRPAGPERRYTPEDMAAVRESRKLAREQEKAKRQAMMQAAAGQTPFLVYSLDQVYGQGARSGETTPSSMAATELFTDERKSPPTPVLMASNQVGRGAVQLYIKSSPQARAKITLDARYPLEALRQAAKEYGIPFPH